MFRIHNADASMVRDAANLLPMFAFVFAIIPDARADCDGPWTSSIDWVYPSDGQTVPIDSMIFASPADVIVLLDGEQITSPGLGVWDPGPLEPGSTHSLEVILMPYPELVRDSVTVTFTVGPTVAAAPSEQDLAISSLDVWTAEEVQTNDSSWRHCVQPRDGCYDTCAIALAAFKVEPDQAIAWRATSPRERVLAFGTCGGFVPVPFCDHDQIGETCFTLEAMGADGSIVGETEHCFNYPCEYGGRDCTSGPSPLPDSDGVSCRANLVRSHEFIGTALLVAAFSLRRCQR